MESAELNKKDEKTLNEMLTQKREALRGFRFGSAGSKTRNVREGRNVRKDIARILTAMSVKARAK